MYDTEEQDLSSGPSQAPSAARRLSDPGQAPTAKDVAARRQSEPGWGHSVYSVKDPALTQDERRLSIPDTSSLSQSFRTPDESVAGRSDPDAADFSRRDTLRPGQSVSDGPRSSYAETSSAAQSFVSLDSPVLTPNHSTAALPNGAPPASPNETIRAPMRSNTVPVPPQQIQASKTPTRRQTTNGYVRQPARTLSAQKPEVNEEEGDAFPSPISEEPQIEDTPEPDPPQGGVGVQDPAAQQNVVGLPGSAPIPAPLLDTPAAVPAAEERRSTRVSETPTVVPAAAARPRVPPAASGEAAQPALASTREDVPAAPRASEADTKRPAPPVPMKEKVLPALTSTVDDLKHSGINSPYVHMLLAVDTIPLWCNLLASFFTWILLAGFVLFPGTFSNLQQQTNLGGIEAFALNVIQHVSLFVIAWACTGIGAGGMIWLSYRWRGNYIWTLNKILMPGFLNSLAGVLSTLSSVLGAQHASLTKSSISTIVVTSAAAGSCGILAGFYVLVLIRRLQKEHVDMVGKQRAGKHGEGVTDVSKRKLASV
ncbi:unnamed protein product [Mycena citricolor]|uniref:Uncharacterized protein n=2 Tax=Mycena citricolor TaxID=2018698 RepID=A0AAD2JYZ0_9AGAR|nr:unnamed protein product [Mycena citricolor]